MLKTLSEIEAEDLNEYYFSAPVRRMIWQTILVIKELVKVLGCEPERIFVEMTRKPDEHKTRTSSRRNKFEELYKKVKDETTDWMQVIANAEEDGKIRSKQEKGTFESFVNSERCKTLSSPLPQFPRFESFVNSERCKTIDTSAFVLLTFESFVNSERCKTVFNAFCHTSCLRALLIQKDVKPATMVLLVD